MMFYLDYWITSLITFLRFAIFTRLVVGVRAPVLHDRGARGARQGGLEVPRAALDPLEYRCNLLYHSILHQSY